MCQSWYADVWDISNISWVVIYHWVVSWDYQLWCLSVQTSIWTNAVLIDLLRKPHNAPVPYSTMHHFVTEMCTCVHISVTKWCIVGYLYNVLWELWDGCIGQKKHQDQHFNQYSQVIIRQMYLKISSAKYRPFAQTPRFWHLSWSPS